LNKSNPSSLVSTLIKGKPSTSSTAKASDGLKPTLGFLRKNKEKEMELDNHSKSHLSPFS